jgi:hypothetical protein
MLTLTNAKRRVIAGLALLIYLSCIANYFLDLHVFGRFDKAALALCTLLVVALMTSLRRSMPMQRPTFSWPMFVAIAAVLLGICGWVEWRSYVQAGSWDFGRIAFLAVPTTLLVFMAHRWRLLRKELLDGTFSDERYHVDPGAYLMGSWRQQLLWMGVAISIVIGLVTLHVILGV